ncbi:putative Protein kinase domain containing protein [Blattamonas nauphoetae]|uniref:Protein kinase domain-containing protein n=1 Tax=Blattamonas nauphoetae TaxID=2049346 RepID=A0ABQ9XRC7_9EUKA|nr:putative Protein kinase domain containing protein [Blattamonas nauphoetae]
MSGTVSVPPGYRFLRNINDGGFGSVVEVSENSTGEHFAMKLMRCTSDKDRKKIEREVKRLRTFVHPGIVELKEVIAMENMQAIAMELGEQSLAQLVKSHSERGILIDRHIVYQVMVDISSALYFMHNHPKERTAHGDVKLENILLFGDGHAKLCDLGAAESEDVSSTRGVMSMQYVSSERINDPQGRASASSDSPFRSEHAPGLIREIGSFKATQIGRSCGKNERELLMRMLDPDCGSRLTSKQLVESRILRCLINTTEEGWKLSEMKSRETEKRVGDLEDIIRDFKAKVAELQTQLKEEQAARRMEQEALTKEKDRTVQLENQLKEEKANNLKKVNELIELRNEQKMEQTTRQKDKEESEKEQNEQQEETIQPVQEQRGERVDEQVVSNRIRAHLIEWYRSDHWSLSGSVFTLTGGYHPTLLSFSFGKVIARFTFTFGRNPDWNRIGIIASSRTEFVQSGFAFTSEEGGAGWNLCDRFRDACQRGKESHKRSACKAVAVGQRVVMEADGREGKRTLKLSQDGETQPVFFSNIPVPFRFAIRLSRIEDSVSIESVEELTEPTLTGGTREVKMD